MRPSRARHQAADGSSREVGIRRDRVVLIVGNHIGRDRGLIGVAVGEKQVEVLRARKNDRVDRAGETWMTPCLVIFTDSHQCLKRRCFVAERYRNPEQLRVPVGLLARHVVELSDIKEHRRDVVRRNVTQAVDQRMEADAILAVDLLECQRGHRLHRRDPGAIVGVPVGVVGHFRYVRCSAAERTVDRVAERIQSMVEGRVHRGIQIDALEGRYRNIVRCRRLAELVEARIKVTCRLIPVVLAGTSRPVSVAQPLGCRGHRANDLVVAPFHTGLPVVARDHCIARRSHAGIGAGARGYRSVEPGIRIIVRPRAVATGAVVVAADHARVLGVVQQRVRIVRKHVAAACATRRSCVGSARRVGTGGITLRARVDRTVAHRRYRVTENDVVGDGKEVKEETMARISRAGAAVYRAGAALDRTEGWLDARRAEVRPADRGIRLRAAGFAGATDTAGTSADLAGVRAVGYGRA